MALQGGELRRGVSGRCVRGEEVVCDIGDDGAAGGLAPVPGGLRGVSGSSGCGGQTDLDGGDVAEDDIDALGELDIGEGLDTAAAGPRPGGLPGYGGAAERDDVGAVGAGRVGDAPLVEVEDVWARGDGVPLAAVARGVDCGGARGRGGRGEGEQRQEDKGDGAHGVLLDALRGLESRRTRCVIGVETASADDVGGPGEEDGHAADATRVRRASCEQLGAVTTLAEGCRPGYTVNEGGDPG